MSASSGLKGTCPVCQHFYNEHNRRRCKGVDKRKNKKGKTEYLKCSVNWYICHRGGHDFMEGRANAPLVCHDCKSHPGGGPEGTGPDGAFPTAESAQTYDDDAIAWEWDPYRQQYYYIDAYGNPIYADQGQSSSSAH